MSDRTWTMLADAPALPPDSARLDAFAITSLNVGGGDDDDDDDDDDEAVVVELMDNDDDKEDALSAFADCDMIIDDESKAVEAKKVRLFNMSNDDSG